MLERFTRFLESTARRMPRIEAASTQILSAVEQIVVRLILFCGFLYGAYRFILDHR